MPSLSRAPSNEPAVGELLTLSEESTATQVVIAPRRGALVTSFVASGRELLYLDRATLNDPTTNVRGGIPILFPAPGKLEADTWRTAGQSGQMKQHGFARNLPWAVLEGATTSGAAATLCLQSNPTTLSQYPWAFRAELSFALAGQRLRISARVHNQSSTTMPFALGYHPYFLVTDKRGVRIDTRATRAFDNVTKQTQPFRGFDLDSSEVDLHLLDHGSSASALHFADGSQISLSGSGDFTHWVVWSLAGKDFVCLEPWTAPGNALNTGDRLFELEPGHEHECWLEIAWHPSHRS
jgi:galactose mutarotase-like enzyme